MMAVVVLVVKLCLTHETPWTVCSPPGSSDNDTCTIFWCENICDFCEWQNRKHD